ncbi:hypothetical protein GCM10023235_54760 [Kitasatospora terrestris]|uniref:Uncharacterized protein n=1 Tax=Kitasatospora terrestris TaxID=258051 RepID=A0ABP9E6T1_9ACTN
MTGKAKPRKELRSCWNSGVSSMRWIGTESVSDGLSTRCLLTSSVLRVERADVRGVTVSCGCMLDPQSRRGKGPRTIRPKIRQNMPTGGTAGAVPPV